jgi:pimeloyl-ACP methyl ester carboxylesterase
VIAIAPAGLWARRDPWRCTVQLASQYRMGRLFAPVTPWAMRHDGMRSFLMHSTVARPRQMPSEAAMEIAETYARTPSFKAHLAATRRARFQDGRELRIQITIAWGDKERLIPAKARRRDELPAGTRFVTLENCGHLAMWDDPNMVAETILQATAPMMVTGYGGRRVVLP